MDVEELREYVLQKPAATEGFPFGTDVIVFKVNNKKLKYYTLTIILTYF